MTINTSKLERKLQVVSYLKSKQNSKHRIEMSHLEKNFPNSTSGELYAIYLKYLTKS